MARIYINSVKQIMLLILLIFISNAILGQTEFNKRKSIYFEIGGSGGLGSINYEKLFFKKNYTEYIWRAGLSFAPIDKNNGTSLVFPLMVSSIIGKGSHKMEFGLGQGITITTKGQPFALTIASIGYRYQPGIKNWFYRITYTPLISYIVDFQVQQWAGISIGYTLNYKSK